MDSVDIRIAFILIACVLASSALMLFIFVRHETAQKETERMVGFGDLKKVFKVREVRLMFPIWLIVATLLGIALTYLPIILLGQHVKGTTIGIAFAGAGVVLGLLQPFWGKVSDRVGRVPVMAYSVFSMLGVILMILSFTRT